VAQRIQHDDRRVFVDPAPRGKQLTWGGYIPQFLGLEACQKMRDILLSSSAFPYLDEQASAVL
jgi:ATP-dependent Lhr-like helicase